MTEDRLDRSNRNVRRKAPMLNITDGQISLNVDPEDRAEQDDHFSRLETIDSKLNAEVPADKTTIYLENIRTGDFTRINENYLVREPEQPKMFTSDSFEAEMHALIEDTNSLIYKTVFFFQGILSGLCLLQVLVLNLSATSFSDQIARIDQCVRIASFVSAFGSFYVFLAALRRNRTLTKIVQINEHRKFYLQSIIAFIVYMLCYIFVVVAHESAVRYNIDPTASANSYKTWNALAFVYTAFAIIGWVVAINGASTPRQLHDRPSE